MVTIVYRLETVDGVGVYGTGAGAYVEYDVWKHPLPQQDSLLVENLSKNNLQFIGYGNLNLHFGFSSVEQLRSWFYNDEWVRDMSQSGIVLSIYEAEEAYLGNSQMCFNRSTAILKSQNNLIEFFKL